MEDLNDKGLFLDELQKLRVIEPDAAEQVSRGIYWPSFYEIGVLIVPMLNRLKIWKMNVEVCWRKQKIFVEWLINL